MAGKKKDFSQVNTNSVYDTIAEATARPEEETKGYNMFNTQETQEQQVLQVAQIVNAVLDRQEEKGRDKKKLKRINMAFTDENYDYINVMSRVKGLSLTDFVNELLAKSREENNAVYQKTKDLLKELNL